MIITRLSKQAKSVPVDFSKASDFFKRLHIVVETGNIPPDEEQVQSRAQSVHINKFGGWIERSQPPER